MKFKITTAADVDREKEKILDLSQIKNKCQLYLQDFYKGSFLNKAEELIDAEQGKGLSQYAFCINGEIPIYLKAEKIRGKISEVKGKIDKLECEIIDVTVVQRKKELNELLEAIKKAIEEEKAKLDSELKAQQDMWNWNRQKAQAEANNEPIPAKPPVQPGQYGGVDEISSRLSKLMAKSSEIEAEIQNTKA